MSNLTIISLLIAMTGISLWRSKARALRVLVVIVHLATLAQFSIYLSNVGRNTFEHVRRDHSDRDTFAAGVFAEAKAAEVFARQQLLVVYVVVSCLAALALWPAVDWRRTGR